MIFIARGRIFVKNDNKNNKIMMIIIFTLLHLVFGRLYSTGGILDTSGTKNKNNNNETIAINMGGYCGTSVCDESDISMMLNIVI